MRHYFGDAEKEGISENEINAIQSIVMAVAAGKVGAQAQEARSRKNKSE